HGGAGGDDDQVGGLEPGQLLVQVLEAGGEPGDFAPLRLQGLDLFQHRGEERPHLEHVLGGSALSHAEDGLLGTVHHVVDLVVEIEGDGGDLGSRPDQVTPTGVLFHDGGVVVDVGGDGHHIDQAGEVGDPSHLVQLAGAAQLFRERDGVDRLVAVVETPHRLVDRLMGGDVEVLRMDPVHHVVGGVRRQEHRTEQRLFCLAGMGRDAVHRPRGVVLSVHVSSVHLGVYLHVGCDVKGEVDATYPTDTGS